MKAEKIGEVPGLLERAVGGNTEAVRALFAGQRERLKRLVRLRLSREQAGRVDESAVVNEILSEAVARLGACARERPRPLLLWLRDLACRRLEELHGRHLGPMGVDTNASPLGEVTQHAGVLPVADTARLASRFPGARRGNPAPSTGRRGACISRRRSTAWRGSTARCWP
jgi:hypothetical protein